MPWMGTAPWMDSTQHCQAAVHTEGNTRPQDPCDISWFTKRFVTIPVSSALEESELRDVEQKMVTVLRYRNDQEKFTPRSCARPGSPCVSYPVSG